MVKIRTLGGCCLALGLALAWAAPSQGAPACKGPNKNDPGCPGTEEPPPPEVAAPGGLVDSVTVDWFNEVLVVRGTGLDAVTSWGIGGFAGPLATANVTPTELDILFDADLAAEVTGAGSFVLFADGSGELTVYVESQVIDPAASGCPCDTVWAAETPDWSTPGTDCLEIAGPGANDPADISGTVDTTPLDPSDAVFAIGASFYPGEPDDSVCRLVQINADASTVEWVNLRINENQQADCRALLDANVCANIIPVP